MKPTVKVLGLREQDAAAEAYAAALHRRSQVVRDNAGLRMARKPVKPVPEKPALPLAPFAFEPDGTYAGRLGSLDECPEGCRIEWRPLNGRR